jgi:formamidopyrimidine-DNA glycosylase
MAEELSALCVGKKLVETTVSSDSINIDGRTVIGVGNCGKLMWMELDGSIYIMITLGMTGKLMLEKTNLTRHTFTFEEGLTLYYNDQRDFGSMIVGDGMYKIKRVNAVGIDIFSPDLTSEYYIKRLCRLRRTKPVTTMLMEQNIIAGVGNYIKSEILYRTGVHRNATLGDLDNTKLCELLVAIKFVAKESYEVGGASIDYVHLDGTKGTFLSKCQVYDRSIDPLGRDVHKEKTADKRMTHYVDE